MVLEIRKEELEILIEYNPRLQEIEKRKGTGWIMDMINKARELNEKYGFIPDPLGEKGSLFADPVYVIREDKRLEQRRYLRLCR